MSAAKALVRSLPPRLRTRLSAKLGRCPRCMRSSMLGTLAGWAGVGLITIFWPYSILWIGALVVAGSFSLLLATHLTIFLVRVATVLRQPPARKSSEREVKALGRREFVATLGKAGVAAFGAALVGGVVRGPSTASAQWLDACCACIFICYQPIPQQPQPEPDRPDVDVPRGTSFQNCVRDCCRSACGTPTGEFSACNWGFCRR
jgi:hypothetical protein